MNIIPSTCVELGDDPQPFPRTQWEQQTVRKLHLHLHSWSQKKNHANLNETVSIVVVIEKLFFVNYCSSKGLARSQGAETKKLLIRGVAGFKWTSYNNVTFGLSNDLFIDSLLKLDRFTNLASASIN